MIETLPSGWAITAFSQICDKPQYGWTCKADKNQGSIKLLRTTDITKSEIDWKSVPFCTKEPNPIEKYLIVKSDILISRAGSVGFSKLISDVPEPTVFASYLIRFKVDNKVNEKYVAYFLKSEEYWKQISNFAAGIAVPNINATKLNNLKVSLAPYQEQRRIVEKLDCLFAKVNACKARMDKVPEILKRFRQSVLADAVSGKLTEDWRTQNPNIENAADLLQKIYDKRKQWIKDEIGNGNREAKRLFSNLKKHHPVYPNLEIPSSWKWASLFEANWLVVDCHNKTAPYVDKGIPLIRTSNIKNGKIIFEKMKYVNQETYDYWSRRCPPAPGDILLTREAPMGESVIIPEGLKLCMGQRMMLLRPFQDLMKNQYIQYCLLDPFFQSRVTKNAVGTGVKHLRVGDVELLTIPIAPLEEQKEIIRRVDVLFLKADQLEEKVETGRLRVNKLTDSILSKAFRGGLVPQDPKDEPAEILLQRIRSERELLAANKKKGGETAKKSAVRGKRTKPQKTDDDVEPEPEGVELKKTIVGKDREIVSRKLSLKQNNSHFVKAEVLVAFRKVIFHKNAVDEHTLLRLAGQRLGVQRLSKPIRQELESYIRTAIRRKIISRNGDGYDSATPTIHHYDDDYLIQVIKSVIRKGYEYQRTDVVERAATHLGYEKISDAFAQRMKVIFRLAIRWGELYRNGIYVGKV